MVEADEIKYMQRAIELASLAEGLTRPNPMVGAVIVHKDFIIGEGYHRIAGAPHAEAIAVASVKESSVFSESVLYVNLEPCSHFGKTPPCAELILKAGIPKVVIGTKDTSLKVSGRGIDILKQGGCEVRTGVLEDECRHLNRRFFTSNERGRPYILLKWAESKDGFIDINRAAPADGPNWITGRDEQIFVHKWRAEEQSILVGANTARIDDPSLNVRFWDGPDPLRIVLSRSGKLPARLKLLSDKTPTVVYTMAGKPKGINVEYIGVSSWENALDELLNDLHTRGIQSVMVEGGAMVLNQFIERNLWDEARVFKGNRNFREGLRSPRINGIIFETNEFGGTVLTCWFNESNKKNNFVKKM